MEISSGKDSTVQATDPSGIVFDTSSGISLEEQQEILAGINAMAGGSRLVSEPAVIKAKKRGFLFPLLVNLAALILLGLGFVVLSHFHGQEEQGIRESSAAMGLTERKLIQEIRQETSRQIEEKDTQINDILSKLSAADDEYRGLQASVETLTEEQKERADYLRRMQDEYHTTLSGLQDERTKILDDSRQREANLRAQSEAQVAALSTQVEQSQANLSAAMEELRRLTAEQDRAVSVEAQINGFYTTLNDQLNAGWLDDASATLQGMKAMLSAPSLQGNRSLAARTQGYLAAIAAVETALTDARRLTNEAATRVSGAAPAAGQDDAQAARAEADAAAQVKAFADLQDKYNALEQKSSDQERAIAAYSSQGSEQGKLISGYETTISDLKTENSKLSTANVNQQDTLNRRDSEIVTLRNENAAKDQQLTDLNNSAAVLQSQLQDAGNKARQSEASLQELQQQNAELTKKNSDLQSQYDDLQRRMDAAVRAFQGN